MLTDFICPDGTSILVDKCFKKCRMNFPCAPPAYLKICADERKWEGTTSVTQLLKGTREAYLKIMENYKTKPEDSAFRVLGTKAHAGLEKFGVDPEVGLKFEGISGTPDEIAEQNGETVLYDYKVVGSFYLAKMIGMTEAKHSGRKEFVVMAEKADNWEYSMQANMYRIMLANMKVPVYIDKMFNFVIVRDGNTYIAKNRGITRQIMQVPISIMNDNTVLSYFREKRDRLLSAIEKRVLPDICNDTECWGGRKCKDYCLVYEHCGGKK